MSPASAADLVFERGGGERVVVRQGATEMRVVTDTPERKVWARGDADVGSAEVARLFGRVVVVTHEVARNQVTVETDRFGHGPFFLARRGADLVFATRLGALLDVAGGQQLDRDALAQALAFGVPLGRRTLVPGVVAIPGGTRITIDLASGALSEQRTWSATEALAVPQRAFAATRDLLIEAFLDGFDVAVRGERVAVTLSGGMDSRCLLAAALHRRVPVAAVNCSVPGSRSASYAEKIAAETRTPYRAHPVGAEFAAAYGERLRGVVELTEGMTFSSEVECHWLRERVGDATVVIHGAFGELTKLEDLHLYFVDDATRAAPRAALGDLIWKRVTPGLERVLLVYPAPLRDELRGRARAGLDARLAALDPGLDSTQALEVLYVEELLGKVTKESSVVWNDRVKTRFPFAYPPFVDLVFATRVADRMTQRFQIALLRRLAPRLYELPDANSGLRVDAPRVFGRAVELADKARRVLTLSRRAQDHADPRSWIAAMQPGPEALLDGVGAFDRAELARLLGVLRAPGATGWNPVPLVRLRLAQHAAATAVEKAMVLALFMKQTGLGL